MTSELRDIVLRNSDDINELQAGLRQVELRVERGQEEQRRAFADFAGEMRGRWDEARRQDTETAMARDAKIDKVQTQNDQMLGGLRLLKWLVASVAIPFILGTASLIIAIGAALLGWGEFGTWIWHGVIHLSEPH
ncbi:MAG: hypothetical protein ABF876_05505 [Acetobacter aceti]